MKGSSHIITILIAILVTIIILSLVGVLDFTPEDTEKVNEKNTTIVYPSRNVWIPSPTVDVVHYTRPRRFVYPRRHLRPIWRGRIGHRVRRFR